MADINFGGLFISFLVLLFSLTVHESAHAWTADRLGDSTARRLGRISLNPAVHVDPLGTIVLPLMSAISGLPVIGWAKPVPVNPRNLDNYRRDYLFIAAAGPASNLVLALAAAIGWRLLPVVPETVGEIAVLAPLSRILVLGLQLNILLAVFNMIPIPPLDGGNVLAGLLPADLADRFDTLRPYGFILLYALMLTGVLSAIIIPPTQILMGLLLP